MFQNRSRENWTSVLNLRKMNNQSCVSWVWFRIKNDKIKKIDNGGVKRLL